MRVGVCLMHVYLASVLLNGYLAPKKTCCSVPYHSNWGPNYNGVSGWTARVRFALVEDGR